MPKKPTHGELIAKLEESAEWTKDKLQDLNDVQHTIQDCVTDVKKDMSECKTEIRNIKEQASYNFKIVSVIIAIVGIVLSIIGIFF